MAKKFVNVGSIVKDKSGQKEYLKLDNVNLKQLMDALTAHGKKHLSGLTVDQISARQKVHYTDESHIPRISLLVQEPRDGAPDFVVKNITLMLEE